MRERDGVWGEREERGALRGSDVEERPGSGREKPSSAFGLRGVKRGGAAADTIYSQRPSRVFVGRWVECRRSELDLRLRVG